MDRREELKSQLLGTIGSLTTLINREEKREYKYDSLKDTTKEALLKIDELINLNAFIIMYDTSLLGTLREGIIFTLDGFYVLSFSKALYANYTDIEYAEVKKGKANNEKALSLKLKNVDKLLDIDSSFLNKRTLKLVIDNLVEVISLSGYTSTYQRPSGNLKKIKVKLHLTPDQLSKCHAIIHGASASAGAVGAGLAQIPLSDNLVLAPIQIGMITGLGSVFNIHVTEGVAKGILSTLAAGFIGRSVSQALIGWIPIAGNIINTTTAAGITEAIGWTAVKHFQLLDNQRQKKLSAKDTLNDEKMASKIKEFNKSFGKDIGDFISYKEVSADKKQVYYNLSEECRKSIIELDIMVSEASKISQENKANLDRLRNSVNEFLSLPVSEDNSTP